MAERARVTNTAPAGLVYAAEFISRDEELDLLEQLAALDYEDVVMHGVTARRSVVHYGFNYGYETRGIQPTEPIPEWLHAIQTRAAHYANLPDASLEQVLVARYPDGAGIGWHRDRPVFEHVVGISLGVPAAMRFRRRTPTGFQRATATLDPRSIYHLSGGARHLWEHSIAEMAETRWSITFRSLAERAVSDGPGR